MRWLEVVFFYQELFFAEKQFTFIDFIYDVWRQIQEMRLEHEKEFFRTFRNEKLFWPIVEPFQELTSLSAASQIIPILNSDDKKDFSLILKWTEQNLILTLWSQINNGKNNRRIGTSTTPIPRESKQNWKVWYKSY
jgi:hypothetical protein